MKLDPAIRERLDELHADQNNPKLYQGQQVSAWNEFANTLNKHWPAISAALAEREGK